MERARHERIILHRVSEHHELCRAHAALRGGTLGAFFNDLAHAPDRVHIDARPRRRHIDGGTDDLRFAERLRDGIDEPCLRLRRSLLHKCGIAADKIHARFMRGPVHGAGKLHIVSAALRNEGDGGDGNALVNNRDAEFVFDGLPRFHKMRRPARDFVIHPSGTHVRVV